MSRLHAALTLGLALTLWCPAATAQHDELDEGLHFLGKPYTPQQLAEKVREVLKSAP